MAKATPTKKATRIQVSDIGAPFMKQNHAGIWCVYFRASTATGKETARRLVLHTTNEPNAQKKFEKWLLSYKDPRGPGATAVALAPHHNETSAEAEARRAKGRDYYHAAQARKIGNGGAKPKSNGHAAPNREMLNAVMQQLSSTMQSMAASLRLLQITLGQDGN